MKPDLNQSDYPLKENSSIALNSQVFQSYSEYVPRSLRDRTIAAVIQENPFFIDSLPRQDRLIHDAKIANTLEALGALGYYPILLGKEWPSSDYESLLHHFTASGGDKMANEVAKAVEKITERSETRSSK
jgi:hypothetical protein